MNPQLTSSTQQTDLPPDVRLLNEIISQINTYIDSRAALYPNETFLLSLINPIYAYAGEKEPIHYKLSPKAKVLSDIGIVKKTDLTAQQVNPNFVSELPSLHVSPHHSVPSFKSLIQELKNKISPHVTEMADTQTDDTCLPFVNKFIKKVNQTLFYTDQNFQNLIYSLNTLLSQQNIAAIEYALTPTTNHTPQHANTPNTELGDFANVPIEIMSEIFKHLNIEDTPKRNRVCRFFNNSNNDKLLWQYYLKRDFPTALSSNSDAAFQNSPQTLYAALYIAEKHKPFFFLPIVVEPDSIEMVNRDPIRLLNKIFVNVRIADVTVNMLETTLSKASENINKIASANYVMTGKNMLRHYGYIILGFDTHAFFEPRTRVDYQNDLAKHLVEISAYGFPDENAPLNYSHCHIPVKFNGKVFVKVETPLLANAIQPPEVLRSLGVRSP